MQLALPKNMKAYPVGFLFPGSRFAELSADLVPANAALQVAHLEDVKRNIEAGFQLMAVPILSPNSPFLAMSVYRHDLPLNEVEQLLARDPAVSAQRFRFEVHSAYFPSLELLKVEY